MAAIRTHPLYAEAVAWPYCISDVFSMPLSFVDRSSMANEDKARIRAELSEVVTVLVVAFYTTDRKPGPLSGAGKLYAFLLHPQSFTVLATDIGNWRS